MSGSVRIAVFVVVLVAGILGFTAVLLSITMGVVRRRGEARVRARLGGVAIIRQSSANSFGRRSRGPWQVRGVGTLVLTPDHLHFVPWVGTRDIAIPRSSITTVDVTRSHLGKTVFRDLLRVTWRDANGVDDAVAWFVPDIEDWRSVLSG